MTNSEEIHRSIAEEEEIHRSIIEKADDIEEVHEKVITVGDVFRSLLTHPAQIITRWNWKAALLGAIFRASFYVVVYKAARENGLVAVYAGLLELGLRFLTSGLSGALVQSFRRATPAWLATLIISVSLPLFGHTVEYFAHYAQENLFPNVFPSPETSARKQAFAVSVLISVISAIFNIFIVRRGVLLVGAGEETKSLWSDVKSLPLLILQFVGLLPMKIIELSKQKRFLEAFGIFAGFGILVGAILGMVRGKWNWAYYPALGAWSVMALALVIAVIADKFIKSRSNF